jgi:hypothetical protein
MSATACSKPRAAPLRARDRWRVAAATSSAATNMSAPLTSHSPRQPVAASSGGEASIISADPAGM